MWVNKRLLYFLKRSYLDARATVQEQNFRRRYHGVPFIDLYEKTTGQSASEFFIHKVKEKHPTINALSHDRLQSSLQILQKFNITAEEACNDPHLFVMNPITIDNYGEILKECGFVKIAPKHIIRYHTLVRSKTLAWLKKENLVRADLNLEEVLFNCFKDWNEEKCFENFQDDASIVTIRMSVLQKFLSWRLGVTPEEFVKYCKNYKPLQHKPISDIQEALEIAQNNIGFDIAGIRSNGFVISMDPINTKLILENVDQLASIDIREVIKREPAIIKNNYNSILQIRNIIEEYGISEEAQQLCLRVYCMQPDTVRERLEELQNLREYKVLKTNPRVLSMVVHKRKLMNRLDKIQAAKKQCYSLNHLIGSSKIFNTYINSFGSKLCGRDLAILISSSLSIKDPKIGKRKAPENKMVLQRLKRHKFWLHIALHVVADNINFLKTKVDDDVIFNNCCLLLYPAADIESYIEYLFNMRNGETRRLASNINLPLNLKYAVLSDDQILSLVLYEIEKKYHFSGDGIWGKQDGLRADAQSS